MKRKRKINRSKVKENCGSEFIRESWIESGKIRLEGKGSGY